MRAQLLDGYCAGGKPRKGRPVLAYFDNPPSFRTWNEVGEYCQEVARKLDPGTINRLRALDPQPDLAAMTQQICGLEKPGAGLCEPPSEDTTPRKKAGIDLRPKLATKEGGRKAGVGAAPTAEERRSADEKQAEEEARKARIEAQKERDRQYKEAKAKEEAERVWKLQEAAEAKKKKAEAKRKKKAEKKKAREEKLAAMTPEEREKTEAEAEQRRLAAKIKKDL